MSTKYIVNNLSGQTINGNPILPKYKVYTALLTQRGGDNFQNINFGSLIIGVSYLIDTYQAGDDFSNVGGPGIGTSNQWDGIWFVATGIDPNHWSYSSALIYNEGAPVVTVLENTIGNIWFTYKVVGAYFVNSNDLFTTDKTAISIDAHGQDGVPETIITYESLNVSNFQFRTIKEGESDNILYKNILEIRIYNE